MPHSAARSSLAPDNADIRSNWLFCLNYKTDVSAEQVFAAHRDWDARHGHDAPRIVHANDRTPDRRLKIGYVSPDFRMHSVAYFLEPLLAAHDRQAVEVTCYAEVARPDRRHRAPAGACRSLGSDRRHERRRARRAHPGRRHRHPGRLRRPHRAQSPAGFRAQAGAGAGDLARLSQHHRPRAPSIIAWSTR